MKHTSAELLINNHARSSGELRNLISQLNKFGIDVTTTHAVHSPSSMKDALQTIRKHPPKLLIIAGGDGTISSAANHIAGLPIELAIIPLGTTNNFARSLNIPEDLTVAITRAAKTTAKPIDLGLCGDKFFTNVAGIGLSADIAHAVTDRSKRLFGRLAYLFTAARLAPAHKPFMVTITDKDSELSINFETHQLIVANGRYHAGKKIAQDAKIDNGELLLFALGGRSKLSLLWHMTDFYIGKRKKIAHASYLIGKDVLISTDMPQRIELDGEVSAKTPAAISIAPASLSVRYKP